MSDDQTPEEPQSGDQEVPGFEQIIEMLTAGNAEGLSRLMQSLSASAGTHMAGTEPERSPLEPLLDEAKALMADFPEESEEEKAKTALLNRLDLLNQARRVDTIEALAHLAFHLKEWTTSRDNYIALMALVDRTVDVVLSYGNVLLEEALTEGTRLGLDHLQINGLLTDLAIEEGPVTGMKAMIGREMANRSPFHVPESTITFDQVSRLYDDNPHEEGEE